MQANHNTTRWSSDKAVHTEINYQRVMRDLDRERRRASLVAFTPALTERLAKIPVRKRQVDTPLSKATRSWVPTGLRGLTLLLFMAAGVFGLGGIGDTLSYYNDIETSINNLLAAGELDVTASTTLDLDPEISCGQMKDFEIEVSTTSNSFPISYDVHVESSDDAGGLCAAMKIDAQFAGDTLVTDSPLLSLLAGPVTSAGVWRFIVSLPADAASVPAGATCTAMFIFRSWPMGTLPEENGFTDTEVVPVTFVKGAGSCGEEEPCPPPPCNTCAGNTTIIVENNNNAVIINNASSSANTGGNSANGGGNITTGNASSSVTIVNNVNQNNATVTSSGTTSTSTSQQIKDKVNDKIKDAFSKLPKI